MHYVTKLFSLYDRLRDSTAHRIPREFGCQATELEIFSEHYPSDLPAELQEFLQLTLPKGSLDIGVYKTCAPRDLLNEQLNTVPFYPNIENDLFGFGWWSGNGDGDGWIFDLVDGGIHAVGHGSSYDHSRMSFLQSESYLYFAGFDGWVNYLEARCEEYGWLSKQS